MSKIKRNLKGITYLYERISYRDEQGRSRNRDKLIRRVDEDGNIIPTKNSRRTKAIIEEKNSSLVPCPDRLAIPTYPNFEHCISFHYEGNAYLQNLTINTDSIQFEDSKMFFKGTLEPISTVELHDMCTNKGIENKRH